MATAAFLRLVPTAPMTVQRDPTYEAGFVRAADHDEPTPEELARKRARRKRLLWLAVSASLILVIGAAGAVVFELRRDTPAKQVKRGIAFSKANSHVSAII